MMYKNRCCKLHTIRRNYWTISKFISSTLNINYFQRFSFLLLLLIIRCSSHFPLLPVPLHYTADEPYILIFCLILIECWILKLPTSLQNFIFLFYFISASDSIPIDILLNKNENLKKKIISPSASVSFMEHNSVVSFLQLVCFACLLFSQFEVALLLTFFGWCCWRFGS